ncbi:MAG: polyphosphate polymerase domain-containing protein [Leucobacter sp.]
MNGMPLHRFAPVGLDELVAEAELLTRIDRKYLVPVHGAPALLDSLDPRTRVLEIDGQREFAYDSVYFDTPDHLAYRLTAQRRRRRFKLRTRSYLDTGTAFLELKTKSGRGSTVKNRMPYTVADRARLTATGSAYIGELLTRHGHDGDLIHSMLPTLVSRYHRVTLLLPCGARATIDTRLQWMDRTAPGDPIPSGGGISLPRYMIVESKSAGAPSELDLALRRAGHRPTGISKFGTGTAALHPELPSNKWARTLRGPFATGLFTTHVPGTGTLTTELPATELLTSQETS